MDFNLKMDFNFFTIFFTILLFSILGKILQNNFFEIMPDMVLIGSGVILRLTTLAAGRGDQTYIVTLNINICGRREWLLIKKILANFVIFLIAFFLTTPQLIVHHLDPILNILQNLTRPA